ncbi:hypothetical protein [Roseibium suaedae]|uniref:N-acetyltransferase domain-containing protein n=1 Tax=Roseibium suaedae TaxID=735517 RepID=A0A1M7PCQ3_9HYPH|nr:hypothetical protein [Roseibium suaedae]SHN14726.1 hypothetical protein SAMN05444272_4300 [Roseibium suaedae]
MKENWLGAMQADQIGDETLDVARAAGLLQQQIRSAGLKLRESTDFTLFEDTIRATEDKYLMEDFSTRFFDLHGTSAFWIGAWDSAGEPVSVQAAKLEDLRDRSLGQYWQQQHRRIFVDPGAHAELGEDHAHDAFFMRGKIVYHGNLWLRRDARGKGLAEALTQLGFLISLLKWSPDYLYGLMAAQNAKKGFGIRVGYRRFVPRGTHWITPPGHIRPDDWLVYSNHNDLVTLARTIIAEDLE